MISPQRAQRPSSNPVRTSAAPSSRLTVGPAHGACEQEAERVAHVVTAAPQQPSDAAERASGPLSRDASESLHDVLRAPGTPLDAPTRRFMERRFGHDFGRVRVHTDAAADASAQSMQAVAYTIGDRIVFRHRGYEPRSSAGLHLIAHELAHTLQSRGGTPVIRRAVNYPAPSITTEDPIPRVLVNLRGSLALTTPTFNGAALPDHDFETAVGIVRTAFSPGEVEPVAASAPPASGRGAGSGSAAPAPVKGPSATGSRSGAGSGAGSGSGAAPAPVKTPPTTGSGSGAGSGAGSGSGAAPAPAAVQCRFKDFQVDVSAIIRQPVPPSGTKWGPTIVDGSTLPGAPDMCKRNHRISVTMIGKPTTRQFYDRLAANEREHVADLKDAANRFLVPYYQSIMALRGTGATVADCRTDLNSQLGRLPDTPIRSFLNDVLAGVGRRDVPGGHATQEATNITDPTNCSTMEIVGQPTQAPTPPPRSTP